MLAVPRWGTLRVALCCGIYGFWTDIAMLTVGASNTMGHMSVFSRMQRRGVAAKRCRGDPGRPGGG